MKKSKNEEIDNSFLSDKDIENKINYNRRAINKKYFVITDGGWYGLVTDVKGWDSFIITDGAGESSEVSIFDVRYVD